MYYVYNTRFLYDTLRSTDYNLIKISFLLGQNDRKKKNMLGRRGGVAEDEHEVSYKGENLDL